MSAQPFGVLEPGMAKVIPFEQSKPPLTYEEQAQLIRDLQSQVRLLKQGVQALGDLNRYYASRDLGRSATDNEAFLHYVFCGGKQNFDTTHPFSG